MKKSNNSMVSGALAVIIAILALIISWKVIVPGYASSKTQIAQLDSDIAAAQAKKDSLDQAESDLKKADAANRAMTVAIPEDEDSANTIAELEAIALKSQITLPSVSISSTDSQTSSSTGEVTPGTPISISLAVSGTFDQLSSFIDSLEKSVKFMNITSMTFATGEDDQLSLALEIMAYSRSMPADTSSVDYAE